MLLGLDGSVITVIESFDRTKNLFRKHVHISTPVRQELIPMLAKLTAYAGLLEAVK